MKSIHFLSLFFVMALTSPFAYSQGCADAGFCTMGAMRPDQKFSHKVNFKLRTVEVGQYIGRTKFPSTIMAYTVDLNVGITDRITAQVKLPYMLTYGGLGSTHGVGDLSLSGTYNLIHNEKFQINTTLGTKIPLNTQNLTNDDGLGLPMYYQTSLGTHDLICGLSLISRKWLVATGWQKPFGKTNNTFWWKPWIDHENEIEAFHYPQAHTLERRADVMFRVQRDFRFSKWNFNIGLLAIHRFNEDRWRNPELKIWKTSEGSDGTAITLLTGIGYNISTKSSLKMSNGFRLLRRDHNPDGLSREYVNTISYVYNF